MIAGEAGDITLIGPEESDVATFVTVQYLSAALVHYGARQYASLWYSHQLVVFFFNCRAFVYYYYFYCRIFHK